MSHLKELVNDDSVEHGLGDGVAATLQTLCQNCLDTIDEVEKKNKTHFSREKLDFERATVPFSGRRTTERLPCTASERPIESRRDRFRRPRAIPGLR